MATQSPIKRWLRFLSREVDHKTLDDALDAGRRGDTRQANEAFEKANRATRWALFALAMEEKTLGALALSGWIASGAHQQSSEGQRQLLLHSMKQGWKGEAMHLVNIGAPLDDYCDTRGVSEHGALADLMYGEFPKLDPQARLDLAGAMMDAGEMRCFNPGMIKEHALLLAFLERAPALDDKDGWGDLLWQPESYARDQVRFGSEPLNVTTLLTRGFPGVAIDLVVRAISQGQFLHARALVDWAGEDLITHGDDGSPTAFDIATEQPVFAAGFWHALADIWAGRIEAIRVNNWSKDDVPNRWPDPELLDLILSFPELAPARAIDDQGRTPAQRAIEICGRAGPLEEIESLWQEKQLEATTVQAGRRHHPRARL